MIVHKTTTLYIPGFEHILQRVHRHSSGMHCLILLLKELPVPVHFGRNAGQTLHIEEQFLSNGIASPCNL